MRREEVRKLMKDLSNRYYIEGKGKSEFCKAHGINVSKLNYWLKVYGSAKHGEGKFIKLSKTDIRTPVRVHLPNGIELEYKDTIPYEVLEKLLSYAGE